MNDVPRNDDSSDDIDDLYRRAAALDPSRPSQSVRNAILSRAAQTAADRPRQSDRAKRFVPTRRRALFGTLAAAVLAGLIVVPQFLLTHNEPRSSDNAARTPAIDAPTNSMVPARPSSPPAPMPAPAAPPASLAAPAAPPARLAAQAIPRPAPTGPVAGLAAPLAGRAVPATPATPLPKASSIAPQAEAYRNRVQANAPLQSVTVTAAPIPPTASAAASAAPPSAVASPAPPYADEALSEVVRAELTVHPAANAPVSQAVLRRAAEHGDLTKVQATLNLGVDVNARDADDRTALLLAVMNNRSAIVELLLAHGADANAADRNGITPLQAAETSHQTAVAAALRAAGAH